MSRARWELTGWDPVPPLTESQLRELYVTLRHIGRAMQSLNRARVPSSPRGSAPDWLSDLHAGTDALMECSNKLIDALEGHQRAQEQQR